MKKSGKGILRWNLLLLCLLVSIIFIGFSGYLKSDALDSYTSDLDIDIPMNDRSDNQNVELGNQWYRLLIRKSGIIRVDTNKGKSILSDLTYCGRYDGSDHPVILNHVRVERSSDSTAVIAGNTDSRVSVSITVTVHRNSPEAEFAVVTNYSDSIRVDREAFLADYDIPVSEVYLKNRKVARNRFEREYWLDKQGVKLGSGNRSSLLFNLPDVSSVQLNPEKGTVIINMEAGFDHPFIKIPFQKDGTGRWINESSSLYVIGDERTNRFSIFFGWVPEYTPRIMLVPDGYLAGYVFTEHADGGTLRTHRAVYFGDEKIDNIADARGGFAGHRIPVTKSVFYEDFDDGFSSRPGKDSTNERAILDFLDQIYYTDKCEVCLHTPDSSNSNRLYLDEAITRVTDRYKSPTWIDHGMYSGNNNREAFVADGLNPGSEYYSADLWMQHGIRYFWSPAVEAIRFSKFESSLESDLLHVRLTHLAGEFWRRYKYSRQYLGEGVFESCAGIIKGHMPMTELNSLQPLRNISLPTPLCWQNPDLSGPFYSWTTEFVYRGQKTEDSALWFNNEKRQLDYLIENRGVFINHGYFVRYGAKDNFIVEKNNEYVVNPVFDEILSYMSQLRDRGDLALITVGDLLDYWVLTKNVTFEYNQDGSVVVVNNNDETIKGLSLAVPAGESDVTVDGSAPHSRSGGEDKIIWFDIPPHARRNIKITN
jgi:hypothetical protein